MSVYKPCDIRGPISELSPELYYRWGNIIGSSLPTKARVVTGGDVRPTSTSFLHALESGLIQAGVHVLSAGIQPTPVIYFVKRHYQLDACCIVTASHSPPEINGLKWMIYNEPPTEEQVRKLEERTTTKFTCSRTEGTITKINPIHEYLDWLKSQFSSKLKTKPFRIVLDFGNGCWAINGKEIFSKLFPCFDIQTINDFPDGRFPSRTPDCSKPEHMSQLAKEVVNKQAQLGIAFDGDGDRVGFVDEKGQPFSPEEATYLVFRTFENKLPQERFIYDIKFSDHIPALARDYAFIPIPERSGHSFIRARMIRENAFFGAEISGHYFYRDLGFGDDGMYTACRVATYVSNLQYSLSELRQKAPHPWITPDIRIAIPIAPQKFIDELKQIFADMSLVHVDGVRVNFPNGWALARPSVTENKITFRFEGTNKENLQKTIQLFASRLGTIGEQLVQTLTHE